MRTAYLSEMITISDQVISETVPKTASGVGMSVGWGMSELIDAVLMMAPPGFM
jgi:hypothetical protein